MRRQLIIDKKLLEEIYDLVGGNGGTKKYCHMVPMGECTGKCVDCLIAHSDGKVREYIQKGESDARSN